MSPFQRLLLSSLGGILALKGVALLSRCRPRGAGWLAFLFVWPGVVPDVFRERLSGSNHRLRRFPRGLGAHVPRRRFRHSARGLRAAHSRRNSRLRRHRGALADVHLGIGGVLPWLLRWGGFRVPLLFDRPWAARSLGEFWGRRWNLAFVEMNQRLFLRPLHRHFGKSGARLALFAISGLLHEGR
jgi:hypothetical protein